MISGGNLIGIDQVPSDVINPVFNKLVTSNGITQVYCVTSVSKESDTFMLKRAYIKEMNKIFLDKAKTEIFDYTCKVNEKFNDKNFRKRVTMALKKLEDYEEVWNSMSSSEQFKGKLVPLNNNNKIRLTREVIEAQRYKTQSFKEIVKVLDEGHQWCYNYFFVIMRTTETSVCEDYFSRITDFSSKLGVEIMQVQTNLEDFLSNFTFLESYASAKALMGINANIMSTQQIARNFHTSIHGGNSGVNNFLGFIYQIKEIRIFIIIFKP